jgi:anti-anti-sigma regulatory factor
VTTHPSECSIQRDRDRDRVVFRITGSFERASAWALRSRMERESAAEVLLDFTEVRDFSDLAVAVLAHGLTGAARRVSFRGLRPHQLRIFRYCGVAVDELSARDAQAASDGAALSEHA